MPIHRNAGAVAAFVLLTGICISSAQSVPPQLPAGNPASPAPSSSTPPPGESTETPAQPDAAGFTESSTLERRTEINLLGQTDTGAGESRRNENIQFNLVDNNALKELRVRLGTTATIIEEFKPSRGYFGAEFGASPTGPLHVSGAGGSGLHGSLYELHQNSVFTARSFFQVGDVQPARENDYGFNVGAPGWKGSHWSIDASQQKLRGIVNGNVLVPQPDERTPLTADPAIRPTVERFLAAYPAVLPNRTDINPRALNTNAPQRINNNNLSTRLDQLFGRRDNLYLQYALTAQQVDAFQLVAGQNPDADIKSHKATMTWNRSWTPRTVTNFSAGFDRLRTLLVPEENAVGTYVSVSGLQGLGPVGSIPIDRALNRFRYAGSVNQVRGSHTWTAGFEVLRRQLNGIESDVHRGFLSFANDFGRDAITNLRLGLPTQSIISIGDIHRGYRNWDQQFYAGDNWRVRPNLTLNFGLRFQPVTSPYEVDGRDTIAYSCDCNNVAPQFGFAYRLPREWGVLRGAYGLQYGQIFPATYQQVRLAPPGNNKIVIPGPDLANPFSGFDPDDPNILPTTYVLDENLVTPYSYQYNFSWEFAAARNWNVQLGYVGSRSHKLLLMWYLNRSHPVEGIPQTSATVNLRRDNLDFAEIRRVINGSRGYFDAARASLVVRSWQGLSFEAAYWFSKAIDLGASYTNTGYGDDSRLSRSQTEFDQFGDMRGLSDFDQPHSFLWSANYETPALAATRSWLRHVFGNWNLATVLLLKQGTPFSIESGSDAPGFGNVDANGGDRPNILDPSILGRTIGDPDTSSQLLPAGAFSFIQPAESAGTLGRNTFRKGGVANLNASLSRSWSLGSEMNLLLRGESINLLNTPQFAEPGSALSNANFGKITNTLNDGRTFRFLLRWMF